MEERVRAWPALAELRKMDRLKQKALLRLHEEAGFGQKDETAVAKRADLDRELGLMTQLELKAQAHPGDPWDPGAIEDFRELLNESPAFVQYLNFYLYFGVLFAAGRIFKCCDPHEVGTSDCNETPVGLPPPPICQDGWNNAGAIEKFLAILTSEEDGSAGLPRLKALSFLDGGAEEGEKASDLDSFENDELRFELWLRRLYFNDKRSPYFQQLAAGLTDWAASRFEFYVSLEARSPAKAAWIEDWNRQWEQNRWREGLWTVSNPLAARCAIADFYWLARILRADVSARGAVKYQDHSWLYLLAMRRSLDPELNSEARTRLKTEMLRQEEVLRSVFAYACDLIQNATEITEECEDWNAEPDAYAHSPRTVNDPKVDWAAWRPQSWRVVQDEEHRQVREHRTERLHESAPGVDPGEAKRCFDDNPPPGWSRRIWSGEEVDSLCGLAFSGGGIRSATFNLGVLQRLQELDLLRHVDYLSTVSGGGYIGAWLIGNVRRTRFWLSRLTSWDASVAHLRRYSNYLAPHNGILSADSWAMWLTWVRNAFLIQLTGLIWLAVFLMGVLGLKPLVFDWASRNQAAPASAPHLALAACMGAILVIILFFLARERIDRDEPLGSVFKLGNGLTKTAAGIAWFGCFITAGLLWGQAVRDPEAVYSFSGILRTSAGKWSHIILWLYPISIALLSAVSLRKFSFGRLCALLASIVLVPAVSYLAICGQLRIFGVLIAGSDVIGVIFGRERLEWIAFVIGPSMTMLAIALAVLVFIGLLGRGAPDWTREWWTRYGAWIAMFGAASLIVIAAAVVAPWCILQAAQLKWSSISGAFAWVGSVYAGLKAGKSTKTGEGGDRSRTLEMVARIGGFLFVAGAIAAGSTLVHLILSEALGSDGQSYSQNLQQIATVQTRGLPLIWLIAAAATVIGLICSNRFDLNTFSLNQFYRNRLVRCYLGATRWQPGKRRPHPFTAFDDDDDIDLHDLKVPPGNLNKRFCNEAFRGPFPIINCTLNLGGSSDLTVHTRQSASFSLTPLYAGATRKKVGFAPIVSGESCFAGGVQLGEAISVSGAAASPNMGYNTSPLVSFMMTLFNVRLGWWFPNPSKNAWCKDRPPSGLLYLLTELLGLANENRDFVNVSDGGHFENLGVYELIRRRARVIIAADAECDADLTFGSLGNLVRICETDFGAEIDLDVSSIRKQEDTKHSRGHCAVGRITYSNGTRGYLIYIKSSNTGDEDVGVAQYHSGHPTFPHESTGNQFYSEDQFEAYRRLGHHITERTFRDAEAEATTYEIAAKLFDVWAPAGFSTESFLQHANALDRTLDRFRTDPALADLLVELFGGPPTGGQLGTEERCACLEFIQLMENVFLDLRLDDFWDHPDHRGWAMLFTSFARSPKFRESWKRNHTTFGIRFEYFCSQHLGLERDRPVLRV